MSEARPLHGLRFRVILGLLLPLLLAIALLSYLRHIAYERFLVQELQRSASSAGKMIESSLRYAMLANDPENVRQTIGEISRQEDVQALFLLDKQGQVIISAGGPPVGTRMDIADPACRVCHETSMAIPDRSLVTTTSYGVRVLRNVNAIENAPECRTCHPASSSSTLGVLVSDFALEPVDLALRIERRNTMIWTIGSIVLILVVVDLMVNRLVIGWLRRLVAAIQRLTHGDLDVRLRAKSPDEYRILADAFNNMAGNLLEKQQLEQKLYQQTLTLQSQAKTLSTLNAVATTVSQSLNLTEVLNAALDEVLESTRLQAGWVFLQADQQDGLRLVAHRGQAGESGVAPSSCIWDRCEGWQVLRTGVPRLFREGDEDAFVETSPCLQGYSLRLCVPLKAKESILGVMALAGDASLVDAELTAGAMEMLKAIGRQIGVAVENARLYEALREKEERHRQLLERLITVQEEERRRIARELHDQTGQPLSSLIMTLDMLEKPTASPQAIKERIQDLREVATLVLEQVHAMALELRPSVLDDLGLVAALRNLFKEHQQRFGLPIDFQLSGVADRRLSPEVQTALYRIAQEALINVARHGEAHNVGVLLEERGGSIVLMVEDDGKGFDVASVMGSRRQERNLGLHGMQERAALVGGSLTIESSPGKGTAVFVEIPLERESGDDDEKDTPAAG